MGINVKREALIQAIERHKKANFLVTMYEGVYGGSAQRAYYGVFDPPSDWVFVPGVIDDSPELKAKLVLIASYREDGSIQVEETEEAKKYLQRTKTA